MKRVCGLWSDQRAATAIEYSLIAALVSIAAITAFMSLGNTLDNTFQNVGNSVESTP